MENKLDLEKMTPRILELLKGYAVEIIRQLITMTDKNIVEDKACRRSEGLVVERRADKRSVMTKIGEIQYERAYFLNREQESMVTRWISLLGFIPYQHIYQYIDIGGSSIQQNKPSSCVSMTAVKAFKTTNRRAQNIRLTAAQSGSFPVIQLESALNYKNCCTAWN